MNIKLIAGLVGLILLVYYFYNDKPIDTKNIPLICKDAFEHETKMFEKEYLLGLWEGEDINKHRKFIKADQKRTLKIENEKIMLLTCEITNNESIKKLEKLEKLENKPLEEIRKEYFNY